MDKISFSPNGEYFAVSGGDGRLKIWETATNKLRQEFIPSSHLSSSSCTCISWAPVTNKNKRKKRKRGIEDIIALGTLAGSILFYDSAKSELVHQTEEGHSGKVNDLCWSSKTHNLFSCGEDTWIYKWNSGNGSLIERWKGGKNELTAIEYFNGHLLVASQNITLWNLETKKIIKTFVGHSSLINKICTVPSTDYFVSMSTEDSRHLKIWSSSELKAVAQLLLPETGTNFHVTHSKEGEVIISVIDSKGFLHIFQHKLNGVLAKPLTPSSTVHIKDSNDESLQVPVLGCYLHNNNNEGDDDENENAMVLLAYGPSFLRFENFKISNLHKTEIFKRDIFPPTKKRKAKLELKNHENDIMMIPNDVKHLEPGTQPLKAESKGNRKRKGGSENRDEEAIKEVGELPMEERLTNLTIESSGTSKSATKGDNLAQLLSQGLHSKDNKILQSVLTRWDEHVILNTIKTLPVQLVVPLLNEIKLLLGIRGQMNNSAIKWLKCTFQVHSAYLMSCSSSEEILGPFMSILKNREVLYPQMCQLKGKLELIRGHIEAKHQKIEPPNEALLVYQDDSSHSEDEGDLLLSESENVLSDDLGINEEEEDGEGDEIENSDSSLKDDEEEDDENENSDSNDIMEED